MEGVCLSCGSSRGDEETCPRCGERPLSDVRYSAVWCRKVCPECDVAVPVDGPLRTVTCGNCLSELEVEQVGAALERMHSEHAALLRRGEEGSWDPDWRYRPGVPGCRNPACLAPLPPEALVPGEPRDLSCAACGRPVSCFPAPQWLRSAAPTAVQCYAADREGEERAPTLEEASKPVVFQCPACDGALKITAKHERTTTCEYCGVDVYIPDPLWKRLHPVKKRQRWFVRFEGKTRAMVAAEEQEARLREDRRRALAEEAEQERRQQAQAAKQREAREAERAAVRRSLPLVWPLTLAALLCWLAFPAILIHGMVAGGGTLEALRQLPPKLQLAAGITATLFVVVVVPALWHCIRVIRLGTNGFGEEGFYYWGLGISVLPLLGLFFIPFLWRGPSRLVARADMPEAARVKGPARIIWIILPLALQTGGLIFGALGWLDWLPED